MKFNTHAALCQSYFPVIIITTETKSFSSKIINTINYNNIISKNRLKRTRQGDKMSTSRTKIFWKRKKSTLLMITQFYYPFTILFDEFSSPN